jgi:SAM-dependent methyltransferase
VTDIIAGTDLNFWQGRWETGQTGWDLGGPHPHLQRLIAEALESGWLEPRGRILEPGCGRAHNGAALARQGFHVVAFDAVERATQEAKHLYGEQPGLTLVTRNALVTHQDWRESFDAIFDRAMLCALSPDQRHAYVHACFEHLRPDGVFLSMPFSVVTHENPDKKGPPYAITLSELTDLLVPGFAMVHMEERDDGATDGRIKKEMLCIWRRRKKMLVETPD